MISSFGDVVELNEGSFLVKNYGKYNSGLGIIIDKSDDDAIGNERITLFKTSFDGSEFNLGNISMTGIVGDFFVSKKGTKLFKKKSDGKHVLLRDNWGGSFSSYYGGTLPKVSEGALYFHRASSNGGGCGYDYSVIPKEWRRSISIEDL